MCWRNMLGVDKVGLCTRQTGDYRIAVRHRLRSLLNESMLDCDCDGLGTRCRTELAENIADMKVGGRRADDEALGNRTVAEALLQQGS